MLRFLQQMPQHTGRAADYVVRVKGDVHIQAADGYQGPLRKHPLRKMRYVLLPGMRYSSDGAAVANLVLYWARDTGRSGIWRLRWVMPICRWTSIGRGCIRSSFRNRKQYFELDRAKITTTERLQRLLVGLLLACSVLLAGLLRASRRFPAGVFVGEAGAAVAGDGVLPRHIGTAARMAWPARLLKVGMREYIPGVVPRVPVVEWGALRRGIFRWGIFRWEVAPVGNGRYQSDDDENDGYCAVAGGAAAGGCCRQRGGAGAGAGRAGGAR